MQQQWQWSIISDLSEISVRDREALTQQTDTSTPFLSVEFLQLLAVSKSVDGDSGWQSHHILIYQSACNGNQNSSEEWQNIIAIIPCYLKMHSYGEYVFDHAWASAYHQHQLAYYPKLVCAVPFTPVTGSRALVHRDAVAQDISEQQVFHYLAQIKEDVTKEANASSLHVLFIAKEGSDLLNTQHMHQRLSVQFVWYNQQYKSFDDFMQQLTSRKRRSIRKERKPFCEQEQNAENDSIVIKTLTNEALSQDVIDAFYLCYQQTYYKRSGHAGYLSAAFFHDLLRHLKAHTCIIAAFKAERMIAGSLFFYNDSALFGRYWGALEETSGLHFECCYYRGIEFAIANKMRVFNPGTQGEHKILRGFQPTYCYSNHYLLEPAFDRAVEDFLNRERIGIEQYHAHASELLPYKENDI